MGRLSQSVAAVILCTPLSPAIGQRCPGSIELRIVRIVDDGTGTTIDPSVTLPPDGVQIPFIVQARQIGDPDAAGIQHVPFTLCDGEVGGTFVVLPLSVTEQTGLPSFEGTPSSIAGMFASYRTTFDSSNDHPSNGGPGVVDGRVGPLFLFAANGSLIPEGPAFEEWCNLYKFGYTAPAGAAFVRLTSDAAFRIGGGYWSGVQLCDGLVQPTSLRLDAPGACTSPDFNDDGIVNIVDLLEFLSAWFIRAPEAQFDDVLEIDIQDLLQFLSCWLESA